MSRATLGSLAVLGLLCLPAAAATTGALVGVDDSFWGSSIGQLDNSLQASEPYGVFNGSVDMTTVNGWLAAGGIHSFALIPPAPTYWGNASMPLAGVPDVGVQEVTLTFDDFSSATVPIVNAAFIKRGIPQGPQREFYEADMTFHDHESPDCNPVNGGPRPILYQVDLSAHQGKQLAFDAVVDLRASGFSEPNKIWDVYEVTEDYDYTTVTYSSLVYDGDHPELPPLAYTFGKTEWGSGKEGSSPIGPSGMRDAYIRSGNDEPVGDDLQHCVTGINGANAMILDFDFEAAFDFDGKDVEDYAAAADGELAININWDRSDAPPTEPYYGPPSVLGLYELIGDDTWDEATVTGVNYCLDGQVANVLGDVVGQLTVDPDLTGGADNSSRNKEQVFTIPQATVTKLLRNEIAGLAIASIDTDINSCIRTSESSDNLWAKPIFYISVTEDTGPGPLPGDANGDGTVSDADYTIWADNYGASGATFAMGDFNGDGEVSDADYTIWADNYGASSGAVPEPSSLALIALGAMAACRRRQ